MSIRRYPTSKEAEAIYAQREADVADLASRGSISASDLESLDRLGRCKVANDHWSICNEQARKALLNDPHHFVRSCAVLAN